VFLWHVTLLKEQWHLYFLETMNTGPLVLKGVQEFHVRADSRLIKAAVQADDQSGRALLTR